MANRPKRKAAGKVSYPASSEDEQPVPSKQKQLKRQLHTPAYHSTARVAARQKEVLDWYDGVKAVRGMPWRKEYDPNLSTADRAQRAYEVWVSEIMLQQTQVATVIPYYHRWLQRFPTLADTAEADLTEAHEIWKGLGYYRRAKLMMEGAKIVLEEYGGMFPEDAQIARKAVRGIGRYTAGAITSIAYNTKAPAVDGNVMRLLSRLLAIHANMTSKQTEDLLCAAADELVQNVDRAGDWNQALIELGSTICKPKDPKCDECPLREACAAWLESTGKLSPPPLTDIEDTCKICESFPSTPRPGVVRYPMSKIRKQPRVEASAVNVIEWKEGNESWFLLVRRPEGGLLGGLWEFPTLDLDENSPSADTLLETTPTLVEQFISDIPAIDHSGKLLHYAQDSQVIGEVLHIFTHIRKTYHALWAVLEGGSEPPALADINEATVKKRKLDAGVEQGVKWVQEADIDNAAIGTGLVKVWQMVQAKRTGAPIPGKRKKPLKGEKSQQKKVKPVVGGDIRQWIKNERG